MAGRGATGPCVIVPVQAVGSAKSRLAEVLPDHDRAELVLAMLTDVLAAVRAAHDGPLLLVTPDEQYEPAAAVARATLLIDGGTGYNEAVRLALAQARLVNRGRRRFVQGFERWLVRRACGSRQREQRDERDDAEKRSMRGKDGAGQRR